MSDVAVGRGMTADQIYRADRDYRREQTERAKRLLRHYFHMAGISTLDSDLDVEIGEIVDAIINAARGLE